MGTEELMTDMMNFNEELVKAGVMLAGEGIHPSARGKRVLFSGDRREVVDGPFAETKELVAGYWIWQVKSLDEAIEWAKRCPNPMGEESTLELRPLLETEDFATVATPEVVAKEARLRAQTADPHRA